MAKVYEAMLLTRHDAPEATQQFLNDYDFSNEDLGEVSESSSTDYDQFPALQTMASDAHLNETYAESYATAYSEIPPANTYQPVTYQAAMYQETEVLESDYSDYSLPVAEIAPAQADYYSDVSVDISIAQSLAATVNALTEDLSVLEVEPHYAPVMSAAPVAVAPISIPVAVQVKPFVNRAVSVVPVTVLPFENAILFQPNTATIFYN